MRRTFTTHENTQFNGYGWGFRHPQPHPSGHRPHQSRSQLPPASDEPPAAATVTELQAHQIRRRPALGGLVNEYLGAA
ncbi:hypothetical protein ACWD4L_43950 [Streptomyces sp. NPDC002596]